MRKLSSLLSRATLSFLLVIVSFLLTSCDQMNSIISGVDEREANLIVVFLETRGIKAQKIKAASGNAVGGQETTATFDIAVAQAQAIEAMALLNKNGLPRKQGTTLLDLFAKQGLMTSDKEETIRYQAGLAQQINNTILMIDGVIDATVQLSFPPESTGIGETQQEPITAAVYVKHQGVYDDPNAHLENKIKRIVSGSVTGLDINNVTVIADRSRFTDVSVETPLEKLTGNSHDYVSIWNIVLNKNSAARFRIICLLILSFGLIFAIVMGWLFWKFYPILRQKGGLKELFNPTPITSTSTENTQTPES
ncbi:MAG: EscJ/YscJ/HrcJ family type III secretion inner membrane ring protein [Chlamydiae bacterium]|nr:EscJ/YscJ/HrcJ family type III secretion inner membrane ring protein [Chlamydiota bacterium]